MSDARTSLAKARRIVVKVGSRALAEGAEVQQRIARSIARIAPRELVVVSSGAIALGAERLGYGTRPKEMPKLQAAAAAGQSVLMRRYDEAFAAHGLTAAQVLLTHADLADRRRLNNARQALAELIEAGAIPIINENDTVATEEIAFGDNDQLAAMVVPLVGAELLVILTDVDGVLDAAGARISVMDDPTRVGAVASHGAGVGSGGMTSKVEAARRASLSGASVVIAPAQHDDPLGAILAGDDVGTLFVATGTAMRARKHWIAFTLRPRGTILLDEGAAKAVRSGRSSVLPVGVLGVRGRFDAGDAVRLATATGLEVGRGLTRLGALDVARAAGQKGGDLEVLFGTSDVVVVHLDDLVIPP